MRTNRILLSGLCAIVGMLVAKATWATSGTGFQAKTFSDASSIVHNAYAVWNSDTANSHDVVSNVEVVQGVVTVNLTAYVYTPGSAVTCQAFSFDTNSFVTTPGNPVSATSFGVVTPVSFSVSPPSPGVKNIISVLCTLGKSSGGGNNATLYGVVP